ncbi:MFS transporter [Rhodococcus opacus]|nr:MFS transporter [Rhodococcus opacus]
MVVGSGATGLVGLVPSYSSIGIWAPLMLVVLRFVQGISAGGEMPGAATFVGEYVHADRRAYQTSFLASAVTFAQLTALVVAAVLTASMPADDLHSWGWRIPFLLALPIGVIGLYIRSRLEETPVFNQIAVDGEKSRSPLRQVLGSANGWRAIGRAIMFNLPGTVPGFLLLTFMPTFLTKTANVSSVQALMAIAVAACVVLVMQPLGGRLCDRIGRRQMLFLVALTEILTAYPAFILVHQGGLVLPTLGLVLIGAPFGLATGSQLAPMLESFPSRLRFTGFAAALGLSTAVISGPSPYVCTWLISVTGSTYAPAWLLMGIALPALVGAFLLRETSFLHETS